ncbi:hypothetical protein [Clostridium sp.]|jgi:spore maturation protein CgeE|uniref:hypothetical protein n=1 Tax=Clostridium sp. TaxID=1506 RepID=UPI003EED53A3
MKSMLLLKTKKFTESHEDTEIIRFYDENLQDKHMHNFTFIKNSVCKDKFTKMILGELEKRKPYQKNYWKRV